MQFLEYRRSTATNVYRLLQQLDGECAKRNASKYPFTKDSFDSNIVASGNTYVQKYLNTMLTAWTIMTAALMLGGILVSGIL